MAEGSKIAAVILEPIPANAGLYFPDPGFLELLRQQCSEYGAVLIFDEVMTGFRVARGGAQELYGVSPDLTALGKVIGGGLPVGAFGGRAEIMDCLSPAGPVYQAGTLSGNPLAMAAGLAQLRELERPTGMESITQRNAGRRSRTGRPARSRRSRNPQGPRAIDSPFTASARCSASSSPAARSPTWRTPNAPTAPRSADSSTAASTPASTSPPRNSRPASSPSRTPRPISKRPSASWLRLSLRLLLEHELEPELEPRRRTGPVPEGSCSSPCSCSSKDTRTFAGIRLLLWAARGPRSEPPHGAAPHGYNAAASGGAAGIFEIQRNAPDHPAKIKNSPMIPPETIEQIAAANDIVDVIGSYFPLKRAGSDLQGPLSFPPGEIPLLHRQPPTPALSLLRLRRGGSVFDFVAQYENIDFPTAAARLAERAGIQIVEQERSPGRCPRIQSSQTSPRPAPAGGRVVPQTPPEVPCCRIRAVVPQKARPEPRDRRSDGKSAMPPQNGMPLSGGRRDRATTARKSSRAASSPSATPRIPRAISTTAFATASCSPSATTWAKSSPSAGASSPPTPRPRNTSTPPKPSLQKRRHPLRPPQIQARHHRQKKRHRPRGPDRSHHRLRGRRPERRRPARDRLHRKTGANPQALCRGSRPLLRCRRGRAQSRRAFPPRSARP